MQNSNPEPRPYRSLFWPLLLIGVGIVWLLGNMGVITAFDFGWLFRLWPLLLIAAGLDILFGRRTPAVGAILGILVVGVVVGLLVLGPSLNLPQAAAGVEERSLSVPLEGATQGTMNLNLSSYQTDLHALNDSPNLFEARLRYQGTLDFSSSGSGGNVQVNLSHSGFTDWWFTPSMAGDTSWQIGLSPSVPLTLNLRMGSGSADLDLGGLQLNSLTLNGASGSANLVLPASSSAYEARYHGASGSLNASLPAATNLTLYLSVGSGSADIRLPPGAAAHLDVRDNGSGSVSHPGQWMRLGGNSNDDTGIWETSGFGQAETKITLIVESLGSGSISVH
jgi:hypothetical protein